MNDSTPEQWVEGFLSVLRSPIATTVPRNGVRDWLIDAYRQGQRSMQRSSASARDTEEKLQRVLYCAAALSKRLEIYHSGAGPEYYCEEHARLADSLREYVLAVKS